MHYAGVNLGHGHVKVQTDRHFFQYASISQRADDSVSMAMMEAQTQRVLVGGASYDVGEEVALIADRTLDKTVFSNWGDSHPYRVLQQSVLDRLAEESLGPWTIAFGIPVSQFKDAAYRQALTVAWRATHRTQLGTLQIVEALAIPEPLGSFWEHCFASKANADRLGAREVIVVDFGYFTTDLNAVSRMVLNPRVANSINKAMREVYQITAERLLHAYGKRYTDLQIEMATLGRWPLTLRGQPIAIGEALSEAASRVATEILNWLRGCVDRSDELILVTGGGAPTMIGFVRSAFPDAEVVMVAEPQQANARGYHRIARRLHTP